MALDSIVRRCHLRVSLKDSKVVRIWEILSQAKEDLNKVTETRRIKRCSDMYDERILY